MPTASFEDLFHKATAGHKPFPYQNKFAVSETTPDLLNVPTGVGKTATAILGWIYRRREHPNVQVRSATPRRLVYCLPMRTLVEQTERVAQDWLRNLDLASEIDVQLLMGGNQSNDWDRKPDRDAILIGTQDMLLSRALNRGYGMSRYRWPVHFGLLNNDCLWVMDETQLMGVGLTTTAQLQGLRAKLTTFGATRSLWMSATLDASPINTVDHPEPPGGFSRQGLTDADREHEPVKRRLDATKTLIRATTVLTAGDEKKYAKDLASEIVKEHRFGTLTLVVLNRVIRAQDVFREIEKSAKKSGSHAELALIHARFRPCDRQQSEEQFLFSKIPDEGEGRIVVATQAIEAGVDVSSATMFTELAPWPSLVQRFGRCNRSGEYTDARVIWIDVRPKDDKDKLAQPYEAAELDKGRQFLEGLKDVGPTSLNNVKDERPTAVVHTLRRKDLLDLWDTTPDLAGNDLDISRFIRESDDTDVQFYWRAFPDDQPPEKLPAPQREELCAVRIGQAKEFLKKSKGKSSPAFAWDALDGSWSPVDPDGVRPGMVLLLKPDAGGYLDAVGWTGDPKDKPTPLESKSPAVNEAYGDNPGSEGDRWETVTDRTNGVTRPTTSPLPPKPIWVKLTDHLNDVTQAIEALRTSLAGQVDRKLWLSLITAARWHDVGKAHPAFQNMLLKGRADDDPFRAYFWAKSDGTQAGRPTYLYKDINRVGFRHELASALAWLAHHPADSDTDLVAFLIAAHHGKVRASIRSLPNETQPDDREKKFARGVWDGDVLPSVVLGDGENVPSTTLDLSLMKLGEGISGPSWLARVMALRGEFGPFRLSFLESLLRVADWHGTETGDRRNGR